MSIMKRVKLMAIIILGMIVAPLAAQEVFFVDPSANVKKTGIEKDIEIAENILSTLLKQETGFFSYGKIKGTYIKEYGVIFSLPPQSTRRGVVGFAGQSSRRSQKVIMVEDNNVYEVQTPGAPQSLNGAVFKVDSLKKDVKSSMIDVFKTFLADYGGLINGLKDEERILITNQNVDLDDWWVFSNREHKSNRLSVEVKSSDLNLNMKGKLSRDQLIKRIVVNDGIINVGTAKDLELMANVFTRLYKSDLSDTYYINGQLYYQYLTDFGAMFRMRVYSSSISGRRSKTYNMATLQLNGLSKEEREQKVKELYPKFKSQLMENIIRYGTTINSLKPDEMVMFKVRLTECTKCGIPKSLEVSIKYDVLQKVKNGSISKDEAVKAFNVVEKGEQ